MSSEKRFMWRCKGLIAWRDREAKWWTLLRSVDAFNQGFQRASDLVDSLEKKARSDAVEGQGAEGQGGSACQWRRDELTVASHSWQR